MIKIIAMLFIAVSAASLLPAGDVVLAADLIEPTRTLDGSGKSEGKLAVFSEPPALLASLDGVSLGKTPTALHGVKPGIHQLRVATSETAIIIEPGQTMIISLYKGSFIKMPEPAEESAKPLATEVTSTPESEPSPAPSDEIELPTLDPVQRLRLLGVRPSGESPR